MDEKLSGPSSPVSSEGRKSLGKLLVEEKLVSQAQLDEALRLREANGGRLGEILVSKGLVSAEDLAAILSIQLGIPFIDLKRHKVQPQGLRAVPEEIARKHVLIPIDVVGDSLVVVMSDPLNVRAVEDVRTIAGKKVDVAIGVRTDIERAIDLNYRSVAAVEKKISEFARTEVEEQVTPELVARTPVAQTLNLILTQAVRDRASDIHIDPQEERLRIRFRVDGVLHDAFSLPRSVQVPFVSRVKVLAEMNIAEQRRPQDGQMSFNVDGRQVDIRVASMSTACGERMTLRILDTSLSLLKLSELGFQPDALARVEAMARCAFGLILVGGPTGSGKTTTLYSMINSMDRARRNIMTIEDPIEYRFSDISQSQVNIKAGLTFSSGLRSIMRHDPNVILVGEIRDQETASVAVQAALTGHLVLSSIHANDAVGVLYRLIDLGVERYLIASTVVGISSQRMVRRLCPHCRAPAQPRAEELAYYDLEIPQRPSAFYGAGEGCNLCRNTGYQARTGIFETMVVNEGLRNLVLSGASAIEIRRQAIKDGMTTMRKDGMAKAQQGVTSITEIMSHVFSLS